MFNAGRLDASILLDTEDYFRLAAPEVAPLIRTDHVPRRASPACRPRHPCADRRQPRRIPRPPTLAAAQWPDAAGIYAGRDALAGGTWMGASSHGRYALVTNFREPGLNRADAPSRGALVERYLRGDEPPAEYMARVHDEGQAYNGFNLIVGDMEQAWYVSNRDGAPRRLVAGLYALSNHLLDTPWPKLARTKRAFADVAPGPQPDLPALYTALADREPAADDELPATGLPPDREKLLSSPFIVSPPTAPAARPCWPCGSMAPGCCTSGATRLTAR